MVIQNCQHDYNGGENDKWNQQLMNTDHPVFVTLIHRIPFEMFRTNLVHDLLPVPSVFFIVFFTSDDYL